MIDIDALLRLIGDLQESELRRWIEERWVRPEDGAQGYVFHEVDVARVRLIYELRYDLAIDEEAMPVVLQLLDQVYGLRRRLRVMREAIDAQPEEVRAALRARLGAGTSFEDEA
jgi:chaperone modulatory protein CbpM